MKRIQTYPAAPVMMAFFPARRPLPFVLVIVRILSRMLWRRWRRLGSSSSKVLQQRRKRKTGMSIKRIALVLTVIGPPIPIDMP